MWLLKALVVCLAVTYGYADDTTEWDFEGKNVVITGGASGIGKAIAEHFAKNNVNKIFIVDKDETQGEITTRTLNALYGEDKVEFYCGDVTTDTDEIADEILSKNDIDIMVCNAGVVDESNFEYTMNVNVLGTMNWGYKFYNAMRKDHGGKGGTIMTVSSLFGYLRSPFLVSYKVSKTAVLAFTYSLGHPYTYRTSGVRVIALCPSFTTTKLTEGQLCIDEQKEIFELFKNSVEWQETDHVGECAMTVYQTAPTATAWTIAESRPAELSPASQDVTAEELDALMASKAE